MWGRWLAVVGLIVAAGCGREPIESFAEFDRDKDGRISREEASADPRLEDRFSELDADGDGELSAGEYLHAVVAERR